MIQKYFISYTGVNLPLKLTNELEEDGMDNRITFFTGYYDDRDRVVKIEKNVYGEVEFTHIYEYDDDDRIVKATVIEEDEEPRTLLFDSQGIPSEQ